MKIKTDFVTNSSSTCFMFVFKGKTRQDLYKLMEKYSDKFDLEYDTEVIENHQFVKRKIFCDVGQVINSIEDCIKNKKYLPYYPQVRIKKLSLLLKREEKELKGEKTNLLHFKDKKDGIENPYQIEYSEEIIKILKKSIKKYKELFNKGFDNYLEIQFGDNDGHISKTDVSTVMDYEGRNIKCNTWDLAIITEQRR